MSSENAITLDVHSGLATLRSARETFLEGYKLMRKALLTLKKLSADRVIRTAWATPSSGSAFKTHNATTSPRKGKSPTLLSPLNLTSDMPITNLEAVVIERLFHAKHYPARFYTFTYARSISKRRNFQEYSVVLNELDHNVRINDNHGTKVFGLDRNVRSNDGHLTPEQAEMLWLILVHLKQRELPLRAISRMFNIANLKDQRIYHPRWSLAGVLGRDLVNRILWNLNNGSYRIAVHGWSLCWIRSKADPTLSELIAKVRHDGRDVSPLLNGIR